MAGIDIFMQHERRTNDDNERNQLLFDWYKTNLQGRVQEAERHYGALQGKNKTEIREEYGDEKFMLWRRSYGTPPPEIDPNDQYAQNNDPRYAGDPVPEASASPTSSPASSRIGKPRSSRSSRAARPCSSPPTAIRCVRSSRCSTA